MTTASKPEGERVREVTADTQNNKIDEKILENISQYAAASDVEISKRIKVLDKELDIERVLEINMATLSLIGLSLGVFVNPYWFILPTAVLLFFVQHALMGWCPPIPVFRALKVRTRPEIDREKYALKALRGDFEIIHNATGLQKAGLAFQATRLI